MSGLRRILVASDFSEGSRAAVARARLLAATHGAELILAHALDGRGAAEAALEAERQALESAGVTTLALRLDGPAADAIADAARAEAADLVVVGSRGRTGLERVLLGSVAERVVRTSAPPVLVARGAADAPFRRVLAASDLGEPAERALATAVVLADAGASIELVHYVAVEAMGAVPVRPLAGVELARVTEDARRALAALAARHRRDDLDVEVACEAGDPRDALARVAAAGHDLVAVGSHGRRGVARALLGSVSEAIVRHAPCSVLVAR